MYNYSDSIIEGFPQKDSYYNVYLNELEINVLIKKSQFAASFPSFLLFRRRKPTDEWDYDKVYEVIKQRLKELHSLGIAHNDARLGNIHVSISGKISLIDFGLSVCPKRPPRKILQTTQNDEDDQILSMHGTNANNSGSQCNDYNNSYDEMVFDRMSEQSQETEWTKEDITSKR